MRECFTVQKCGRAYCSTYCYFITKTISKDNLLSYIYCVNLLTIVSIMCNRYLLGFFWLLSASKPKCNFWHWSKMTLKSSSYLFPKFSRVPLTIVLIPLISTIVNGTLLNFGKRYEYNLRVIFDQWPKLHLGLDALSNHRILNGI